MATETILVIEDDPTLLRVIKDNLEFQGYAVLTANDGEAGLTAAMNGQSNLIILDIMSSENQRLRDLPQSPEEGNPHSYHYADGQGAGRGRCTSA